MAAKKTKKVAKKQVTPKTFKHHHHWHHHDFLIILFGGFIIIVLVLFASRSFTPSLSSYVKQQGTSTPMNEDMLQQNEKSIAIKDFSFSPAQLTIKTGTTVTWTNEDEASHSVLADDGSFNTGSLGKSESGSVTFSEAGTYRYHCAEHPNMTGIIVVEK